MAEYEDVGVELRMTPKQARELTELLGDPEFRERLTERPQETLREYGIEISGELAEGAVFLPGIGEIDELLDRIPGGRGFRAEDDETCFYIIWTFTGALARSE